MWGVYGEKASLLKSGKKGLSDLVSFTAADTRLAQKDTLLSGWLPRE